MRMNRHGSGVVSIPHGYDHTRPGTRIPVAEVHSGVSVGDGLLLRPKSPFPETAIDDVAGCLQYEGEVKTLDEMERAIAQGVREHQRGVD